VITEDMHGLRHVWHRDEVRPIPEETESDEDAEKATAS
jgi:hypothetical protein